VNEKIPLPDLEIEYETPDHEQARVDLELATKDYRARNLVSWVYAPMSEADRVRAAVQDPHLISEILSL